MILPKPEIIIQTPRSLRQRLDAFLDNQYNYCNQEKKFYLQSFQSELLSEMCRDSVEGMTDEKLILGLELNNYIRQVDKHVQNFTKVSIRLGVPYE